MRLTVSELISNVELNDWKVEGVFLDIEKREFKLVLEGGYWRENSISKPKLMENGGIIKVRNYNSFEARYFLPTNRLWYTLDYSNLKMMDEVNRKTYENSILRLAGMEEGGYWIEFLINGGEFEMVLEG